MKFNRFMLVCLLLLTIVSLSSVSANEEINSDSIEEQNMDDIQATLKVSDDIIAEDMMDVDEDKLTTFDENIMGEITSDNVTVDVSDVYVGCETTISVTAPGATGIVNITVADKTYAPEFIGGVATQTISEYSIGLNNVTINYNGIFKETSFKVLDGVITNETFDDYFERVRGYYYLRGIIPEDVTLDFRGHIAYNYLEHGVLGVYINKPHNITSTTCDADLDISNIFIQSDAFNSNVSNIKMYRLSIYASNCNVVNSTIGNLNIECNDQYSVFSDTLILNCTIDGFASRTYFMNNASIINSTFNNGLDLRCGYEGYFGVSNISIRNCIVRGKLKLYGVYGGLIENCTLDEGYMDLRIINVTVKNNFINASSLKYAIDLFFGSSFGYNHFIDNKLYSKNYYGNRAIAYQDVYDNFYPELHNVFENNTPTQPDLNIGFTSNPIFYGENITVIVNMPGIEGNIVFYFNDEKISTVKLANGTATQTIGKYYLGINNITAKYEDLINDICAINHTSINVNKVDYCPINLFYENVTEGKTSVVNITLPKDANGTILFRVYNNHSSILIRQEANGSQNQIRIPPLLEGNYTMDAVFTSVKYVTNSSSENIAIIHIPVYKLTAGNVVMDYKDGSKYKVLVTKDGKTVGEGEVVKITFNGVTKNVKTDKNGYATLALDAAPKTYTIKAIYNGMTKSTKVTIKNILKASNISKKKAKKIKFFATLKNSKGKAIVGKKITFKIKGKTYLAKTNKKGVATITLKNLKVGKYAITSKYGACTVKNTIKIKK